MTWSDYPPPLPWRYDWRDRAMKLLVSFAIGFMIVGLMFGCGGAATDADTDEPVAVEDHVAAPVERVIPLCEGEEEPEPGECQTLVYGAHGYCNRWSACQL